MGTWTTMYSRSRAVRFPTVASLLLSMAGGYELQEKWLVDDPTWPVPLLQLRCALGSRWCWLYITTGTFTSRIWSGSTLTGKLQSKEAGDLTGSKAGPCGGILRTIFHFMWVELSSKVFFWVGVGGQWECDFILGISTLFLSRRCVLQCIWGSYNEHQSFRSI